MTVKTYSANSMRSAIVMVKKELGDDALILSTRRLQKPVNDPYRDDIFQIEAMPAGTDVKKPLKNLEDVFSGEPVDDLFTEKRSVLPSTGWESVQNELGGIKEMLCSLNNSDVFSDILQTHPGVFNIYAKFIRSGLSEKRAQMLITRSFVGEDKVFNTQSDYTKLIFQKLLSFVKVAPPFYEQKNNRTAVVAFVGPTGVGKTTTIAKLAAKLYIEQKKKVGLISVDNYRIGAFDQLKTYSAIIGIPCIPAFTKKDLVTALNKLGNMDFILVDTAGQSHLDKKRLSELKEIMSLNCEVSNQLVISAATGRLDMKELVESFKILNPSSYIFSKVDETKRRGRIIDQIIEFELPVSFITNGQEVPEDLIVASEKNILQLLINPEGK